MATVHITVGQVTGVSTAGASMPVARSVPISADTMTSSGTSAQSSITASTGSLSRQAAFWSITVTGGNVFVAFGPDPTAASDTGHLLIDGTTRDFAVTASSEKIAVIDA